MPGIGRSRGADGAGLGERDLGRALVDGSAETATAAEIAGREATAQGAETVKLSVAAWAN